jgi:GNAT superfamily N-acetyltransferase
MTMEFSIETYDEVIADIRPLLIDHWLELAAYSDIPLDPNYDHYQALDRAGLIRIYTARLDGALIGYVIMTVIKSHPHYRGQAWAVSDIVLVLKEHRNFGVGNGLFDLLEDDLKGSVVQIHTKNAHPELQILLKSRGYDPIETTFSKRL